LQQLLWLHLPRRFVPHCVLLHQTSPRKFRPGYLLGWNPESALEICSSSPT